MSKLIVDCFAELHSQPNMDFMQVELTGGSSFGAPESAKVIYDL